MGCGRCHCVIGKIPHWATGAYEATLWCWAVGGRRVPTLSIYILNVHKGNNQSLK
jgi:hypothetical protein